ncbi:pseudaminic acid cytidylyltransferase [Pseudomonas sp.]|uniref:pseudaminic acid cytidylyltransferase n=1 Tax=Pseudomonas sp. TaxID=306 RepID=UPI002CA06881|nr:pseudaminic acid cytidylyltransferase [Pseudomonas sp.]HUE91257.1 pseudaminic acid cytidylyltransferase [Pseudomonas sp.]
MKLAVIPARGGSKRIALKNIRPFCGQPMLAWSIQAAQASGCFDEVMVSTDDPCIAELARELGACVPFMRPAELADDYTGTTAVVANAVRWYHQHRALPAQVCCIYATAPFLQAEDLRRGLLLLEEHSADYAFSVTSFAFPIQRGLRLDNTGRVAMFQPEYRITRSQDLEDAYHDAGQFYWGRTQAWLEGRPVFEGQSVAVRLPRHRVQDIDTEEDWQRAEWLFRAMQAGAC